MDVDGWQTSVRNCVVSYNDAGRDGGGILCGYSALEISDSLLLVNRANEKGGAFCFGSVWALEPKIAILENCIIAGNNAGRKGGATYSYTGREEVCYSYPPYCWTRYYPYFTVFVNSNIDSNVAGESGGGIAWDYRSQPSVFSCTLRNHGTEFSGEPSDATVSYSCVAGGWFGQGNISADPQFVYPWDDRWGDFHLRETSPCVDAGNPDPAYDDACRPPGLGTVVNDMGAYGGPDNCDGPPDLPTPEGDWTPQPTPTVTPTPTFTSTQTLTPTPTARTAGVTGDGSIDGDDLFFFSQWWDQPVNETNYPCDTVEDGFIDGEDLIEVIRDWREMSFAP